MKRQSFIKWSLTVCLMLMVGETMAQGVVVYRKNGAPIKVPYSELDSISTYNYDEEPEMPGQDAYLTCPDNNHPHLIDLGLPSGTKWACCNVGANKPEAYGDYYAWGETETKSTYDWSSYIHCDGSQSTCHNIGSDIAGTQYDVAHVQWGGSWVMPSQSQIKELVENCTHEWTTLNGVNGRNFTGTNGGTIFLPALQSRQCRLERRLLVVHAESVVLVLRLQPSIQFGRRELEQLRQIPKLRAACSPRFQ